LCVSSTSREETVEHFVKSQASSFASGSPAKMNLCRFITNDHAPLVILAFIIRPNGTEKAGKIPLFLIAGKIDTQVGCFSDLYSRLER